MALISCNQCKERISSRYAHCPHCGQAVDEQAAGDAPAPVADPQLRRLRHRAQDLTSLSLLLMVVGSIWYYADSQGLKQAAGAGPVWTMAAGASLYLYLRIWLLLRRLRRGRRPP